MEKGKRPDLLTEHTDGHVDNTGGMLGGGGWRVQDGLEVGAAAFQHVQVGLGLCQVGLSRLRGQVVPLAGPLL